MLKYTEKVRAILENALHGEIILTEKKMSVDSRQYVVQLSESIDETQSA